MKRFVVYLLVFFFVCVVFPSCVSNNSKKTQAEELTSKYQKEVTTAITSPSIAESLSRSIEKIWEKNSITLINQLSKKLIEKGWNDVNFVEGEVDTRDLGIILPPLNISQLHQLYTIKGKTVDKNNIVVVAFVVICFTDEKTNGEIVKITYVGEGGRDMESTEILSAEDPDLWEYMYSY